MKASKKQRHSCSSSVGDVELDGNMRLDVHSLEDGGRVVVDRGFRGGRAGIGQVELQEGIGIGVHGAREVGSGEDDEQQAPSVASAERR